MSEEFSYYSFLIAIVIVLSFDMLTLVGQSFIFTLLSLVDFAIIMGIGFIAVIIKVIEICEK
jgi:hypothetical protein